MKNYLVLLLLNFSVLPSHGIAKCPLVSHYRISTDAVGQTGVVCLLYHEYWVLLVWCTAFCILYSRKYEYLNGQMCGDWLCACSWMFKCLFVHICAKIAAGLIRRISYLNIWLYDKWFISGLPGGHLSGGGLQYLHILFWGVLVFHHKSEFRS